MSKKPNTWIWQGGIRKCFQDMSLEEQDDFWNDLEEKSKGIAYTGEQEESVFCEDCEYRSKKDRAKCQDCYGNGQI